MIEFLENIDESSINYTYAIILAKYGGKWVFVKHKDRNTWELPAGHVESNETVEEAAERELREETGAKEYELAPLVSYRGLSMGETVYGRLFSADIKKLGPLPDFEIAEVKLFDEIPENLTYPEIQTKFLRWYGM